MSASSESEFEDDIVEQPFFIFYHTETTGLSRYDDHIIKITASADREDSKPFSSLVHTNRPIHPKGTNSSTTLWTK